MTPGRRFSVMLALAVGLGLAGCSGADPGQPLADGSNSAFHHEVTTAASPASVWDLWMDVDGWKDWDKGLADAAADSPLALGTAGTITALNGQVSGFVVTEFIAERAYAFATDLPLATLTVERRITGEAPTRFRHDVTFTGPMGWAWAMLLGAEFRAALPPTMATLANLAAQGEVE
ncbi:MAG: SRPBCC family protein [Candidatus Phaeomarinobacter sp.]